MLFLTQFPCSSGGFTIDQEEEQNIRPTELKGKIG
jgi:hypothetical protein